MTSVHLAISSVETFISSSNFQVIKKAEFIAAGFLACGLEPGQNTFVGLYAVNRPEVLLK